MLISTAIVAKHMESLSMSHKELDGKSLKNQAE